jgi:predicted Zn-ribbon and HTH transcriptional regulator
MLEDLKAKALAASAVQWVRPLPDSGVNLITDLVAAANPAAVLELIERLEKAEAALKAAESRLHEVAVCCANAETERGALKVELNDTKTAADGLFKVGSLWRLKLVDCQKSFRELTWENRRLKAQIEALRNQEPAPELPKEGRALKKTRKGRRYLLIYKCKTCDLESPARINRQGRYYQCPECKSLTPIQGAYRYQVELEN